MSSISQQQFCENYYNENKEGCVDFKKWIRQHNLKNKKYYCKLCNVNCRENGDLKSTNQSNHIFF